MWSVLNLFGGVFQLSSKLLKMTARPRICDTINSQIMIEKKHKKEFFLFEKCYKIYISHPEILSDVKFHTQVHVFNLDFR